MGAVKQLSKVQTKKKTLCKEKEHLGVFQANTNVKFSQVSGRNLGMEMT